MAVPAGRARPRSAARVASRGAARRSRRPCAPGSPRARRWSRAGSPRARSTTPISSSGRPPIDSPSTNFTNAEPGQRGAAEPAEHRPSARRNAPAARCSAGRSTSTSRSSSTWNVRDSPYLDWPARRGAVVHRHLVDRRAGSHRDQPRGDEAVHLAVQRAPASAPRRGTPSACSRSRAACTPVTRADQPVGDQRRQLARAANVSCRFLRQPATTSRSPRSGWRPARDVGRVVLQVAVQVTMTSPRAASMPACIAAVWPKLRAQADHAHVLAARARARSQRAERCRRGCRRRRGSAPTATGRSPSRPARVDQRRDVLLLVVQRHDDRQAQRRGGCGAGRRSRTAVGCVHAGRARSSERISMRYPRLHHPSATRQHGPERPPPRAARARRARRRRGARGRGRARRAAFRRMAGGRRDGAQGAGGRLARRSSPASARRTRAGSCACGGCCTT